MSTQRFNGLSFNFTLGDLKIQAKKFTLDITDNSAAAKRNGRPDGYLIGDVEGSGTITVDRIGLRAVMEAAKSSGSLQQLEPFDINSYAKAGSDEFKIVIYGCKLKISKLLDIDRSSSDESEFELPYIVTDSKFVTIDGVPIIENKEEQ